MSEKKVSLIDITSKIQAIISDIMDSGGEVTEESFAELEQFRGKLEAKGESIAYVVKSVMESRIERLKALKKQADVKLKVESNAQERLREYLKRCMVATNTKSIKGDLYSITLIEPKAKLSVIDESKTPARYITVVTTNKIDYKAILDDLKAGKEVPGYEIGESEHGLMIK